MIDEWIELQRPIDTADATNGNGDFNTDTPADPSAYVGAYEVFPERFEKFKEFKRFIATHSIAFFAPQEDNKIRIWKPSPQRLSVHLGDWKRYWGEEDQKNLKPSSMPQRLSRLLNKPCKSGPLSSARRNKRRPQESSSRTAHRTSHS